MLIFHFVLKEPFYLNGIFTIKIRNNYTIQGVRLKKYKKFSTVI